MVTTSDKTGQVFGMLTVTSRGDDNRFGNAMWNCICGCGAPRIVRCSFLTGGRTKSCGCLKIKHGHTRGGRSTPEYKAWESMRDRCSNADNAGYDKYGGRGISVCSRWSDSFSNFISDMGLRPSKSHSIDRIDNSLGYFPVNCKWATKQEQSDNRRVTVWHTSGGVTKPQTQWCRDLGGSRHLVDRRLRMGWAEEQALTTPAGQRRTPTS